EAVAAATSDIARAESRGESAAAGVQRTRSAASAGAEAAEAAGRVAAEAREAFERGWRDTVADGHPASFEGLRAIMSAHTAEQDAATQQLGVLGERLKQARTQAEDAKRMRADATEYEAAGALAATLAQEMAGPRFVAYVQHEAMSLLANDASGRLADFTSGRYELTADGDEFEVVDRLNGDERRSVKTLSGGETFLASLALALSLSEHLPQLSGLGGSVSLESLFLDEGFGSLDAESLDLAVQGLETLAGGNRVIGVISHVAELAERLPDRIEVVKGPASSTVRA
ncbi:MAG: SMC family ATPase, partial [Dehalococcoidia bacterium]|nr:SMC family ATPase [Dehalococcoidia bacterium]